MVPDVKASRSAERRQDAPRMSVADRYLSALRGDGSASVKSSKPDYSVSDDEPSSGYSSACSSGYGSVCSSTLPRASRARRSPDRGGRGVGSTGARVPAAAAPSAYASAFATTPTAVPSGRDRMTASWATLSRAGSTDTTSTSATTASRARWRTSPERSESCASLAADGPLHRSKTLSKSQTALPGVFSTLPRTQSARRACWGQPKEAPKEAEPAYLLPSRQRQNSESCRPVSPFRNRELDRSKSSPPNRADGKSASPERVAAPSLWRGRSVTTTSTAAATATLPRCKADAPAQSPAPPRWRSSERAAEGLVLAKGPKGQATDKPVSVSGRYGAPALDPTATATATPAAAATATTPAATTTKWNTLPRRNKDCDGDAAKKQDAAQPASDSPSRMYGPPSWYKQNRELKRRSTAIMQKVIQVTPDGALLDLLADETDAAQAAKDEDDLEDLRNTVKRLSGEVARLQSELNSARLQEFEAQEAAVTASAELDESRRTQAELAELRGLRDNMAAAAGLVQKEVAALRQQCEQERQTARRMKTEADMAVKERNVLAHQSSLLAEALSQDDRLLPMLAEVENLKRLLEEERCHVRELQALQEPHAADGQGDELELLDERLKIAEEELRHAATRADRAERENDELRERLSQMEKELEERKTAAPPPPPPPPMAPPMPPPPPPPPMPALGLGGGVAGVKLRTRGGSGGSGGSSGAGSSEDLVNAERNATAVQDMANLLGIPRKPQVPEAIPGGAIDNLINEIKGGRFTLKATEQKLEKEKKEPPAVTEMLNILGTLRRRPKASAENATAPSEAPRDVAL